MRNLVLLTFFSICAFTTYGQEQVLDVDFIKVTFNENTTMNDLLEIKSFLSKREIDLYFSELEFKDEKLVSISFDVNCNDGFRGSASSGSNLSDQPIGFYRDFRVDAVSAFGTGSLREKGK